MTKHRNKQKAWRLGARVLNQLRRTVTGHVPAARAAKDIAAAAAPLARRTRSSTLRPEIADPGVVNFFRGLDHATFQAALNAEGFEEGAGTCSNAAAP